MAVMAILTSVCSWGTSKARLVSAWGSRAVTWWLLVEGLFRTELERSALLSRTLVVSVLTWIHLQSGPGSPGRLWAVECFQGVMVTGHGVAQCLERQTRDPKDRDSNPIRSTRKMCEFSRVKIVVLHRCRCAQPPYVYAHTRMITYAR